LENILDYGGPSFENAEYGKIRYENPAYAADDRLVIGEGNYGRIEDIILEDAHALQRDNPDTHEAQNSDGDSKTSKDTAKLDDSVDSGLSSGREDNGTLRSRTADEATGTSRSTIFIDTSERAVGTEQSSIFVDAATEEVVFV
jgi:hypothetical protein